MQAPSSALARVSSTVTVLLTAAFVMVGASVPGEAWAQKKKVVVEQFKGPAGDKYRIAVMKSLGKSGVEVVPDKALVKLEADMGLQRVADNYPAVAKELKLTGFVSGIITGGRRPKARVIVRNASGKPIGGKIFQATSAPKLMAMVFAGSGPNVASVLGNVGGGGGGGPVAAAEPEPAAAEAAPAEPSEDRPRKRKARVEDDKAKEEAAEGAPAEAAEAEVAAEAESEGVSKHKAAAGGKGLRVAAVLRTFSRNFTYSDNKAGRQQGYQAPESKFNNLPLVPAPGIAIEFFPVSTIGVFAAYNKAIVGSKDSGNSIYTTSAFSYALGVKGRFPMAGIELEPSVSYADDYFKIDNFSSDPNRIQVAPVDYKQAKLGGGVRIPLSSGGSFDVGAHYLYMLSTGDILSDAYFKGSATGGELSTGLTMPLSFAKGLDFNVGLDFRRIVFAFTPNKTPANGRIAGGATDQYIGLNLGVGYNMGL